jgi:hypothetical protein
MRILFVLLGNLRQSLLVPVPAGFEVEQEPVKEGHAADGEGIEDDGVFAGAGEVKATRCKG